MDELIRLTPAERAALREPPPPRKPPIRKLPTQNAPKPLDEFFAQRYPWLSFPATASPEAQWRRLVHDQSWSDDSEESISTRSLFDAAYDKQFSTAIVRFFKRMYPEFEYNPRAEAKAEFERLRQLKRWFELDPPRWPDETRRVMKDYWLAREGFFNAFVSDFEEFFGEGNDVSDWVYLCDVLRVKPTPKTIEHCRSALKGHHVNIYDLYYHVQTGAPLMRHANIAALSEYSIKRNMLYPLKLAKTTCMKFLLRDFQVTPGYIWDDWSRKLLTTEECKRVRERRGFYGPRPVVNRANERSEVVVGRQWWGPSNR